MKYHLCANMNKINLIPTMRFPNINVANINKTIEELLLLGINYYRFNLGKISAIEEMNSFCNNIINIKKKYKSKIKIMLDLPYPANKPRLIFSKNYSNIIEIKKGESFFLTSDLDTNNKEKYIGVSIDCIGNKVCKDEEITYSDGFGFLRVKSILSKNIIQVESLSEISLVNGKSISNKNMLFNTKISKEYYNYLKMMKPDSIAFSFVNTYDDALLCQKVTKNIANETIYKIETFNGVSNIKEILKIQGSIMIARGDLGINVPINKFYEYQNNIFKSAKKENRKTYVSTDVLLSIIDRAIPSRADLIDIAHILSNRPYGIILSHSLLWNGKMKLVQEIIHRFI